MTTANRNHRGVTAFCEVAICIRQHTSGAIALASRHLGIAGLWDAVADVGMIVAHLVLVAPCELRPRDPAKLAATLIWWLGARQERLFRLP
jgi:hypothetical protein